MIYRQIDQIGPGEASMMPLLHGVTNAARPERVWKLDRVFGWDAELNLHHSRPDKA